MPAFAATYPERTLGSVVVGCFAHYDGGRASSGATGAATPWTTLWIGSSASGVTAVTSRRWPRRWPATRRRGVHGRAQRLAATPTAARALLRMMLDVDVRPLLPAIRVPVVILLRIGDVAVDVSHSRYMAEDPGSTLRRVPGADHLPWIGDAEPAMAEIQELVTGTRPEPEPDRVVATVMFVDAPPRPSGTAPGLPRRGGAAATSRGSAVTCWPRAGTAGGVLRRAGAGHPLRGGDRRRVRRPRDPLPGRPAHRRVRAARRGAAGVAVDVALRYPRSRRSG